MKTIFYIQIPTETLYAQKQKNLIKAAICFLGMYALKPQVEIYEYLADEDLGLKISFIASEKTCRNIISLIQDSGLWARGLLTTDLNADLEIPGYEALDINPRREGKLITPGDKIIKVMRKAQRRPYGKRKIKFTRPQEDYSPCPICGEMTITAEDFITQKNSHVYRCRERMELAELASSEPE